MSLRCDSTIAPMSMPGSLNFSTILPRSANDGSADAAFDRALVAALLVSSAEAAPSAGAAVAVFFAVLAVGVFAAGLRVTMVFSSVAKDETGVDADSARPCQTAGAAARRAEIRSDHEPVRRGSG